MKPKKRKSIIFILVIALIVIGAFVLHALFKAEEGTHFEFAEVKYGDIENLVSSSGTLSAVETVEVGSQVSGIIDKLHADFNDPVKKGQVLAVLDKTLFKVSVRDAEAGVSKAKAKLAQAEAEVKRNRPLFESGNISEMEFMVSQTSLETAKADLETAQAALLRARTNLDYTVIRSPIDGTVIERNVDAGQTIAASFQAPQLFLIAKDLTRMQIETDVDESDIGMIKEKQLVRFTVQAYPDITFEGTVRQVRLQPTTIQNVVNYTVVVDANNEKGMLLPGMTATVDFIIEERHNVLTVSNTALIFRPTTELMKKYGSQLMKKMQSQKNETGVGTPGPTAPVDLSKQQGSMPGMQENMGIVFYLDKDGIPTPLNLETGITDGVSTEVVKGEGLTSGMQLLTAAKSNSKSTKNNGSFLLPPPPGGGPR